MGAPFGKADAEIGGKKYSLVFNFGAMAAIERHPLGEPFQVLVAELAPDEDNPEKTVRISTVALLLWGCLRAKHRHVSFDEVGEMLLDEATQEQASDALVACLSDAFPESGGNPRKRTKAGTGTSS